LRASLNSPRRKGAAVGSCNPRSRRLDFALSLSRLSESAGNNHYTLRKSVATSFGLRL
jgi:hypothetical protein